MRSPSLLSFLLPCCLACGTAEPTADGPQQAQQAQQASEPAGGVGTAPPDGTPGDAEAVAQPDAEGQVPPPSAETPLGEDWDGEAATTAAADEPPAAVEGTQAARPCKISWSNGAVLRFQYSPEGGTARVDHDRDGKPDVCATFSTDAQKTTRLQLDEACDGAFELELTPEHDPNANVAVAEVRRRGSDTETPLTLVTLPSFVGLDAGYTLHAPRKDTKLTVRSGRVRKAEVRKPSEGPTLTASFTYDGQGRITRIEEDFEIDGTVDRRFDYRYDESGKITRMQVTTGQGDAAQTGTARLDYTGCEPG